MARKPATKKATKTAEPKSVVETPVEQINLTAAMSTKARWQGFNVWIIGITPLICHAWSEKAKREMLAKQVKAIKPAKEERDPEEEFAAAIYRMPDGRCGFPVTGIKRCILSVAHKDRGIPRSVVQQGLFFNAVRVPVPTAFEGASCNLPLVPIFGGEPIMREDMVRVGSGLKKTASFAYRAEFWPWAIHLRGRLNISTTPPEVLSLLANESGFATGVGDWRNEKSGVFGSFSVATEAEQKQWEAYAAGRGPLPDVSDLAEAAE
jgi:hypothetical protein